MAKALDWTWSLPQGQTIRARFDPATRTESVWLEKRLVSRATPEGKKDVHVVALGAGGAYRGANEAKLVFETTEPERAFCTLTVDGQVLSPKTVPPVVVRAAAGGSLGLFAFAALRIFAAIYFPRHRYKHTETVSTPVTYDAPHSFSIGAIAVPASTDVAMEILPAVDRCWVPNTSGHALIELTIDTTGKPSARRILDDEFPRGVSDCIAKAAMTGHYVGTTAKTVQIPVEYRP